MCSTADEDNLAFRRVAYQIFLKRDSGTPRKLLDSHLTDLAGRAVPGAMLSSNPGTVLNSTPAAPHNSRILVMSAPVEEETAIGVISTPAPQ